MLKQFSTQLIDNLNKRMNKNIIGGGYKIRFNELRDFVIEMSKQFNLGNNGTIERLITHLRQNQPDQIKQKVVESFKKVTKVDAQYDQIIDLLQDFRFVVHQIVQQNISTFDDMKQKMEQFSQVLQNLIELTDDFQLKDIFNTILRDFDYILTLEEFLHQKIFKHVKEADKSQQSQPKDNSSGIYILVQFAKLIKFLDSVTTIDENKFIKQRDELTKLIQNSQLDEIRINEISKIVRQMMSNLQSSTVQLDDVRAVIMLIVQHLSKNDTKQERERIIEKLKYSFQKIMQKKTGGGGSRSIRTTIKNQKFKVDNDIIIFKDKMNQFYTKITRELFKIMEDQNLESVKIVDIDFLELITTLQEIFEQILDNRQSLPELLQELQDQETQESTTINATFKIDTCIQVVTNIKETTQQDFFKKILESVHSILLEQKQYIQQVASENLDNIENDLTEQMQNRVNDKIGGNKLDNIFKHYYETKEILEKLSNLLLVSQMSRNIQRSREELKTVPDNTYLKNVLPTRLKNILQKLKNYIKSIRDKSDYLCADNKKFRQAENEFLKYILRPGDQDDKNAILKKDKLNQLKQQFFDNIDWKTIDPQIDGDLLDTLKQEIQNLANPSLNNIETCFNRFKAKMTASKKIDFQGDLTGVQDNIQQLISLYENIQSDDKHEEQTQIVKRLTERVLLIKEKGYLSLLQLTEMVENYLNAQTNNILNRNIKQEDISNMLKTLVIQQNKETYEIDQYKNPIIGNGYEIDHLDTVFKDDPLMNSLLPIKRGTSQKLHIKGGQYKKDQYNNFYKNYWKDFNKKIDELSHKILGLECFHNFSMIFHMVCQQSIQNTNIGVMKPELLESCMKDYILSSCLEIDEGCLIKIDQEKNNHQKYLVLPGFIRIQTQKDVSTNDGRFKGRLQTYVGQDECFIGIGYFFNANTVHPITDELDILFNQIIQSMSQKVINMLGMYRTYENKKIDLQIPRLLFGGNPEEVENNYEVRKTSQSIDYKQFVTYFRVVLLCEYYAKFFNNQQKEKNENGRDLVMVVQPVSGTPVGKLLNYFFSLAQKTQVIKYSDYAVKTIIKQINTIQASSKQSIFDQIVSYINTNYGILYKNEVQDIKDNLVSDRKYDETYQPLYTFDSNDQYNQLVDGLEISKASSSNQFITQQKNEIQDDYVSHNSVVKLIDEQLKNMYNKLIDQCQKGYDHIITKGLRAMQGTISTSKETEKLALLKNLLNNKQNIYLNATYGVEMHEKLLLNRLILHRMVENVKKIQDVCEIQNFDGLKTQKLSQPGNNFTFDAKIQNLFNILLSFVDGKLITLSVYDQKLSLNTENMIHMLQFQQKFFEHYTNKFKYNKTDYDTMKADIDFLRKFFGSSQNFQNKPIIGGDGNQENINLKTIVDIFKNIDLSIKKRIVSGQCIGTFEQEKYDQNTNIIPQQEQEKKPVSDNEKSEPDQNQLKSMFRGQTQKCIVKCYFDVNSIEKSKQKIFENETQIEADQILIHEELKNNTNFDEWQEYEQPLQIEKTGPERQITVLMANLIIENVQSVVLYKFVATETGRKNYTVKLKVKKEVIDRDSMMNILTFGRFYLNLAYQPYLKKDSDSSINLRYTQVGKNIYIIACNNATDQLRASAQYYEINNPPLNAVEKDQVAKIQKLKLDGEYQFDHSIKIQGFGTISGGSLQQHFRYSNFAFYDIFDIIPSDLYEFNTIMRNFIKSQLLNISSQPKTYQDLFESIFENEYYIIDKISTFMNSSVNMSTPKIYKDPLFQSYFIDNILYDGYFDNGGVQYQYILHVLNHNKKQTPDTVYMFSILYFMSEIYAQINSSVKERQTLRKFGLIEENPSQQYVKKLVGSILYTLNELNTLQFRIQTKIDMFEGIEGIENDIQISQSLNQRIKIICQNLTEFIKLKFPSMVPAYNSNLLYSKTDSQKSGLMSHFTQLITGEILQYKDYNNDYITSMGRYLFDKLVQNDDDQTIQNMISSLYGKFNPSEMHMTEQFIWFLNNQQLQTKNINNVFNNKLAEQLLNNLKNNLKKVPIYISQNSGEIDVDLIQNGYNQILKNVKKSTMLKYVIDADVIEQFKFNIDPKEQKEVSDQFKQLKQGTLFLDISDEKLVDNKKWDIQADLNKIKLSQYLQNSVDNSQQTPITYQQSVQNKRELLILSRDQLMQSIRHFVAKDSNKGREIKGKGQGISIDDSDDKIHHENMCDLGIVPFNYSMMKKDVPLLNIVLNSSMFRAMIGEINPKLKDNDLNQTMKLEDFQKAGSKFLKLSQKKLDNMKYYTIKKIDNYVLRQCFYNNILMYSIIKYSVGGSQDQNVFNEKQFMGMYVQKEDEDDE